MILFVVVIYAIEVDRSTTVSSLLASLENFSQEKYQVLIVNNSLGTVPQEIVVAPSVHCVALGENLGLARAYNLALARSYEMNATALATFDQDSFVTVEYLSQVFAQISSLGGEIVGLCPVIRSAGRTVSPFGFTVLGWPRYGVVPSPLYAINSFSVYSVEYLASIGGFEEYYWLDALDFSTYARIARQGRKVQLLDVIVNHDLSLLSGAVSKWRMVNISRFEASFLMEYGDLAHIVTGGLRLIVRTLRVRRYGLGLTAGVSMLAAVVRGAREGWRRRISQQGGNGYEKNRRL